MFSLSEIDFDWNNKNYQFSQKEFITQINSSHDSYIFYI